MRRDQRFSKHGHNLRIERVGPKDNGEYTCEVNIIPIIITIGPKNNWPLLLSWLIRWSPMIPICKLRSILLQLCALGFNAMESNAIIRRLRTIYRELPLFSIWQCSNYWLTSIQTKIQIRIKTTNTTFWHFRWKRRTETTQSLLRTSEFKNDDQWSWQTFIEEFDD